MHVFSIQVQAERLAINRTAILYKLWNVVFILDLAMHDLSKEGFFLSALSLLK